VRRAPALAAALAAWAAGAGCLAAPAAASPEAAALATAVAAPWPAMQAPGGGFQGYLPGGDGGGYGQAMLGLGLLQTGLRDRSDALVDSSLRAVGAALATDSASRKASAFEEYALAAAYNLARRRRRADPRFGALRPAWAAYLRGRAPLFLGRPRGGFFNKHVVEAAAWLELARSGLRSRAPGAVLHRPRRSRAAAARYLLRSLPRLTDRSRRRGLRLLADPAPSPLAYQALSLGFYARSLRLLGRRERRRAGRTLAQAAAASLALAAPDGDLAYTGRSQEQSWALSFTAFGSEVAARRARPGRRRSLRGLAARALGRLRLAHPVGPRGLALVPALAAWDGQGATALDPYVDGSAYTGLTLVGLNWSAALGGRPLGPAARARPRRRYAILKARGGRLAVVETPRVWFAVRERPAPNGDLRSDAGLVALKLRGPAGFGDLLRLRPRAYEPAGGAGPLLLRGTAPRRPSGRRLRASRRGVTVAAGWARLRWRPLRCGVRLRWRGPRRAAYEYSAFFPAAAAPAQVSPRSVAGAGQRVSVSGPAGVALEPGYASAVDAGLVRARIRFAADARGRASITVCSP
jgi:hypothetical protein